MDEQPSLDALVMEIVTTLPNLRAREIGAVLRARGMSATTAEVSGILRGALRGKVQQDSEYRWTAVAPRRVRQRRVSGAGERGASHAWTEDQTALVLWAMPVIRAIQHATGREFSSLAMKMANLLAIQSEGREGLPNASNLDRAVVAKYGDHPDALEARVAELLNDGTVENDRSVEVARTAVDLLRKAGIPLHADVLALMVRASEPTRGGSKSIMLKGLRASADVSEGSPEVFSWTPKH